MPGLDVSRIVWRKSSFSGNGPDCVEVGVWRNIRNGGEGRRVETLLDRNSNEVGPEAGADRLCLVRDSKDPGGPVLAVTPSEWGVFLDGVKRGRFR